LFRATGICRQLNGSRRTQKSLYIRYVPCGTIVYPPLVPDALPCCGRALLAIPVISLDTLWVYRIPNTSSYTGWWYIDRSSLRRLVLFTPCLTAAIMVRISLSPVGSVLHELHDRSPRSLTQMSPISCRCSLSLHPFLVYVANTLSTHRHATYPIVLNYTSIGVYPVSFSMGGEINCLTGVSQRFEP
jgi:hypothetical protein